MSTNAQQEAKEAALEEICAAQNVPFPGPRQRRILDAVFPIIWKARGKADWKAVLGMDRAFVTSEWGTVVRKVDAGVTIAALDD